VTEAKKLDRRVARTRRALGNAIIELALESGYDKISIRDLTERADIGYATFYRHYKSKDELLTSYLSSILLEIANELNPDVSHYEQYVEMFDKLAKYRDAVLIGLSLPRDHPAMQPLWQKVFDLVTSLYLARDESVIPLRVSVNHIIRSVSEMIRWWLTEGQEYGPEQMATMQSELIITVIEQVAVVPRDGKNREDAGSHRKRETNATDAPPRIPN
jgi:AcrR family transcriptional regulator